MVIQSVDTGIEVWNPCRLDYFLTSFPLTTGIDVPALLLLDHQTPTASDTAAVACSTAVTRKDTAAVRKLKRYVHIHGVLGANVD